MLIGIVECWSFVKDTLYFTVAQMKEFTSHAYGSTPLVNCFRSLK